MHRPVRLLLVMPFIILLVASPGSSAEPTPPKGFRGALKHSISRNKRSCWHVRGRNKPMDSNETSVRRHGHRRRRVWTRTTTSWRAPTPIARCSSRSGSSRGRTSFISQVFTISPVYVSLRPRDRLPILSLSLGGGRSDLGFASARGQLIGQINILQIIVE